MSASVLSKKIFDVRSEALVMLRLFIFPCWNLDIGGAFTTSGTSKSSKIWPRIFKTMWGWAINKVSLQSVNIILRSQEMTIATSCFSSVFLSGLVLFRANIYHFWNIVVWPGCKTRSNCPNNHCGNDFAASIVIFWRTVSMLIVILDRLTDATVIYWRSVFYRSSYFDGQTRCRSSFWTDLLLRRSFIDGLSFI